MKLVEVIQGVETSVETLEALKGLCKKAWENTGGGKRFSLDSSLTVWPGITMSRRLKMLEENNADIQTIDKLLRASGFKMGSHLN
jgi:3-hydroxybutyryl-CoA dehydrogenase